jgi:ABC-type glycerol-3-phosphate transport system substrate-binding protein
MNLSFPALRISALGLLGASLLAGAGCGQSSSATGATSGSVQEQSVCAGDPRAETYVTDMEATATDSAIKMKLVDSNPGPPVVGNNTWQVMLLDENGAPITGLSTCDPAVTGSNYTCQSPGIVLNAWMPDHGHGSEIHPTGTPMGTPGMYELNPVYLFMPGIWTITVEVTLADKKTDQVVYTFCVNG